MPLAANASSVRSASRRRMASCVQGTSGSNISTHRRPDDPAAALAHARAMLADGVDIIDVGGESTRPGAPPTAEADEIVRVVPILESLRTECDAHGVVLSIDTRKPAVMRAAIAAGASMVN